MHFTFGSSIHPGICIRCQKRKKVYFVIEQVKVNGIETKQDKIFMAFIRTAANHSCTLTLILHVLHGSTGKCHVGHSFPHVCFKVFCESEHTAHLKSLLR